MISGLIGFMSTSITDDGTNYETKCSGGPPESKFITAWQVYTSVLNKDSTIAEMV